MADNTNILNILPFFLNIAADKWVDWNGDQKTGENLFNQLLEGLGVPPCDIFTCGAQGVNEGTVSLYIQNPMESYNSYGFNESKKVSTDFEITLMLPSGSFAAERLKQILSYKQVLLTCLEALFSKPADCVSGWVGTNYRFAYYTLGGEDFSPSQESTTVTKTKIVVSVSAQGNIQGV